MIYGVIVTFHLDCETEFEAFERVGRLMVGVPNINHIDVIPKCEECNDFHEEDAIPMPTAGVH